MNLFSFLNKVDVDFRAFEKWLDASLSVALPSEIQAFCFNLYEDEEGSYSVEIVGSPSFDRDDSDWACDEVFTNRETPFRWKSKKPWKGALDDMRKTIERYLQKGKYASLLRSKKDLGCGFVDGDMELLNYNIER